MNDLPESVRPLFLEGGWQPGRQVSVSSEIPPRHSASSVLAEFAGLRIGRSGPGQECAASDIAFHELDQKNAIAGLWSELLQTKLIGVADVHNAHSELYVSTDGRWFKLSLIDDEMCYVGSSFSEAMERILSGRRCRPMLRPGQQTITFYGEKIMSDDPRVYRY